MEEIWHISGFKTRRFSSAGPLQAHARRMAGGGPETRRQRDFDPRRCGIFMNMIYGHAATAGAALFALRHRDQQPMRVQRAEVTGR